jgi:hypothetical protein
MTWQCEATSRRTARDDSSYERLIPDGDARVRAVIKRWGLRWPDDA